MFSRSVQRGGFGRGGPDTNNGSSVSSIALASEANCEGSLLHSGVKPFDCCFQGNRHAGFLHIVPC